MSGLARSVFPRRNGTVETISVLLCRSVHSSQETSRHPFANIHPWKSREDFIDSLADGIVYDKDGLVALNKPYGVSTRGLPPQKKTGSLPTWEPSHNARYTLSECLPGLARRLGYQELTIAKAPEKYTTGVVLLAANETIQKGIERSRAIGMSTKTLCSTYRIVTTKVPRVKHGEFHVAVKILRKREPPYKTAPVLLHEWSKSEQKRSLVKTGRIRCHAVSNSIGSLNSLVDLETNQTRWGFLRLFAVTEISAPILGDNIHGSRLHRIKDSWALLDPFHPIVGTQPTLDPALLNALRVSKVNQYLIPLHAHLKSYLLPKFLGKEDLRIDSPPPAFFSWTCEQLRFRTEKGVKKEEEPSRLQELAV